MKIGLRSIIHLDMDAFYASVEVLDNPELKGKPVIVGGSTRRCVVSAASYEARKFGIHSAMPIVTAHKLCPKGIFLPVRMNRYRQISKVIFSIYDCYTPLIEPLSLDEAFLDVTNSRALYGPAKNIAEQIKNTVKLQTGLTVSAGIANSKLIAKIASDHNKPDGLTEIADGGEAEFLDPLPITRLWGVGKKTLQEFTLMGVRTIGDLRNLSEKLLVSKFGRQGTHLYQAARGLDDRPVEPIREMQSIGHEETFATDISSPGRIHRELLALAARVGQRARHYGIRGRTINLKVKFYDFQTSSRSATLASPTSNDQEIFSSALKLLEKTEAINKPLRLLGIALTNLVPATAATQTPLFEPAANRKRKIHLYQAIDQINQKYGSQAIIPSSLLTRKE